MCRYLIGVVNLDLGRLPARTVGGIHIKPMSDGILGCPDDAIVAPGNGLLEAFALIVGNPDCDCVLHCFLSGRRGKSAGLLAALVSIDLRPGGRKVSDNVTIIALDGDSSAIADAVDGSDLPRWCW